MKLLDELGAGNLPEVKTNVEISEKTFLLMLVYTVLITASVCSVIGIYKCISSFFKS